MTTATGAMLHKQEQELAARKQLELENAIELAVAVHQGQVDKQGVPYILHPLRVMLAVAQDDRVPAVLHDVIEDGDILDPAELEAQGISRDNALLVFDLTRRVIDDAGNKEPYENYIRRFQNNPRARAIKIADLRDNVARLPPMKDAHEAARLMRRYLQAIALLAGE